MSERKKMSEPKKTLIACLMAVLFLRNEKRAEIGNIWRSSDYYNKDLATLDWQVWALRKEIAKML